MYVYEVVVGVDLINKLLPKSGEAGGGLFKWPPHFIQNFTQFVMYSSNLHLNNNVSFFLKKIS